MRRGQYSLTLFSKSKLFTSLCTRSVRFLQMASFFDLKMAIVMPQLLNLFRAADKLLNPAGCLLAFFPVKSNFTPHRSSSVGPISPALMRPSLGGGGGGGSGGAMSESDESSQDGYLDTMKQFCELHHNVCCILNTIEVVGETTVYVVSFPFVAFHHHFVVMILFRCDVILHVSITFIRVQSCSLLQYCTVCIIVGVCVRPELHCRLSFPSLQFDHTSPTTLVMPLMSHNNH